MTMNDALNRGQSYACAFKRFRLMQTLKHAEEFMHILHIEPGSVVPDKYRYFIPVSAGTSDFDFGRGRVRVNLTAFKTRLTRTSFSMERSP